MQMGLVCVLTRRILNFSQAPQSKVASGFVARESVQLSNLTVPSQAFGLYRISPSLHTLVLIGSIN